MHRASQSRALGARSFTRRRAGRARGGLLLHPAPSAVAGGPAPARRSAGAATRSSPLSQVVCGRAARVRVVDVLPAVVAGGLRPPGEAVGSACAAARSCAAASACIPATTTRAAAAATRRAAAEVAARTRGRALHERAGAVRSRGAPSESARESEGGKARGATRAGEATREHARARTCLGGSPASSGARRTMPFPTTIPHTWFKSELSSSRKWTKPSSSHAAHLLSTLKKKKPSRRVPATLPATTLSAKMTPV